MCHGIEMKESVGTEPLLYRQPLVTRPSDQVVLPLVLKESGCGQ